MWVSIRLSVHTLTPGSDGCKLRLVDGVVSHTVPSASFGVFHCLWSGIFPSPPPTHVGHQIVEICSTGRIRSWSRLPRTHMVR